VLSTHGDLGPLRSRDVLVAEVAMDAYLRAQIARADQQHVHPRHRGDRLVLAIAINIFLIPLHVATIGFTASIIVLSVPLFALALLVSRLPFLDTAG
jgi:hypothetical protein